jgi:enamine deaminase RidA (YjgF/YER057c/UK114 family)
MADDVIYYNPPGARKLTSLYSHVSRVKAGEIIYIAGQIGTESASQGGDFEAQFNEVFDAIGLILDDLGADFNAVAKLTTYVVGPENITPFRELRDALFPKLFKGPLYPPNTLLVVERLGNPEWLLEVETVARLPD